MVVFGLSVRLSWYPMWGCGGCSDCDASFIVCVGCEYAERVRGCVHDGGSVVVVSAGHEYVGSATLSSAVDVLGKSVVRGMGRVGGVCEM